MITRMIDKLLNREQAESPEVRLQKVAAQAALNARFERMFQ